MPETSGIPPGGGPRAQAEAETPETDQPSSVGEDGNGSGAPAESPGGDADTAAGGTGNTKSGGTTNGPGKTGHKQRPTLVVRYGRMGLLGRFRYSLDRWRRGQRAVVKSDRGIEIGTIVCRWVRPEKGRDGDLKIKGEVLRLVTHADEIEERHLQKDADREFEFCKARIAQRNLPMKLVGVEHLFGGDRIIFYFVADKRVDFRALVRDLAREFQTRIEMRQIGVRDEARLLGDYERCGRPLCCRAFIKNLEPVSMKMAKVQKATLDPSKISGRCGRLMCCLRFEHATYKELAKNLPRRNTEVGTAVGRGKVVGTDVVTQMVTVLLESGSSVTVPVESLVSPEDAPAPGAGTPSRPDAPDDRESHERRGETGEGTKSGGEPGGDPEGSNRKKRSGSGKRGGRRAGGKRRGRKGGKSRKAKNRKKRGGGKNSGGKG